MITPSSNSAVRLRRRRRQRQVVERTDDRRRRLQERVRDPVRGTVVHHPLRPAPQLVASQALGSDTLVDGEVDDVLAVVGASEEELARHIDGR